MTTGVIRMSKSGKSLFKDKVMALLPDGGNLNHVPALHLCVSHENRHSPAGVQCQSQLAQGTEAKGNRGIL